MQLVVYEKPPSVPSVLNVIVNYRDRALIIWELPKLFWDFFSLV